MLKSGIEKRSWILPRFHHRDPKIRKNHKIKTSGSVEISSKWMKKFQKNQKSAFFELFMYSHGLHLPRFHRIHVFENRYLRVTYGAGIRKKHEILWVDRPLLGGINEIIDFCKTKTTMMFQCNIALIWIP